MRLPESSGFMLLLLTLVLVVTAGNCHGRRIPGAEVVVVTGHGVEPPPTTRSSGGEGLGLSSSGKCKEERQRQRRRMSRWSRRLQDFSESKRKVPSGPNPLHN
jgi:hypothetical protein